MYWFPASLSSIWSHEGLWGIVLWVVHSGTGLPRAVRDRVNQSSIKEFFNLLLDNVVGFLGLPFSDFAQMVRSPLPLEFWQLIRHPSKHEYSRWVGSSWSSTREVHQEDLNVLASRVLVLPNPDEVGSSLEKKTNLLLQNKRSHCPEERFLDELWLIDVEVDKLNWLKIVSSVLIEVMSSIENCFDYLLEVTEWEEIRERVELI
ncbi:hypothetical protein Tco_0651868 [Tanacetum coccineum]|uniref:DUF4378 domain-containing protein n=1 Tax=Tanacetum coccineum TaxID=301880 RepID=A0ABQ4WVY9_9ASTR